MGKIYTSAVDSDSIISVQEHGIDIDASEACSDTNTSVIPLTSNDSTEDLADDFQIIVPSYKRRVAIVDVDAVIQEMRVACKSAGFTRSNLNDIKALMIEDDTKLDMF
mmetsp:Transcript_32111/g.44517  ORF Transcript_32111/g.44517 Transcript_32111/m.44517 type:complete len:108 (-) Transcript_32111:312-635(-)|eukprot:CAMPEP_0196581236 /NCGR_PEP_ID=MMETSP1081-20130531/33090_1 /TAXON_ID=36882 /ORGANISM="Pyramimonas amylifera, Strain CCMP720" /LENGTH=107 /DNA_ID=CAMNT_0041901379 /DNA_START=115 /DNA_END=438 /DNA_ORIENTATION=+